MHTRGHPPKLVLLGLAALAAAGCGRGRVSAQAARPTAPVVSSSVAGELESAPRSVESEVPAPQITSDWSVPARYQGQIAERPRGFSRKIVALTFDDGPEPAITPQILRHLADYGANATFFVIGYKATDRRELLKKEAEAGHAIGDHSWSHTESPPRSRAQPEVHDTALVIQEAVGRAPTCFRPPCGKTGTAQSREAAAEGLAIVNWTVHSVDTKKGITSDQILRNVSHVRPGDIILMHDGSLHQATANAVPTLLEKLSEEGYECVTVPEMLRAWDEWLAQGGDAKAVAPRPRHRPASKPD